MEDGVLKRTWSMWSNSYYLKHRKIRTLKFDAQRILKSIQMIGSMWLIPQKWLYSDRFLQPFCLIVVDIFTRMSNPACFLKRNPLKCTYFEGKKDLQHKLMFILIFALISVARQKKKSFCANIKITTMLLNDKRNLNRRNYKKLMVPFLK